MFTENSSKGLINSLVPIKLSCKLSCYSMLTNEQVWCFRGLWVHRMERLGRLYKCHGWSHETFQVWHATFRHICHFHFLIVLHLGNS